MESPRLRLTVCFALFACLVLPVLGCGSDEDEIESATTRAIREKVRADMERERLQRVGRRLASVNEALANAPTAIVTAAMPSEGDDEASSGGGISLAEGERVYTQNCASCHGARGQGDGPLSAGLQPQPARHADGQYMNALSNEHLYKVIAEGGAAVGKSALMAPWGTTLSEDQIQSTIGFVRTLADPPYSGPSPTDS